MPCMVFLQDFTGFPQQSVSYAPRFGHIACHIACLFAAPCRLRRLPLTCFKPACHTRAEASALVHSCCSNAKDLLAPVHKLQYSTLGMSYIRKYSYACIVPSRKYAAVLLSFVGACA